MSKESFAAGLGKVFFSYTQDGARSKVAEVLTPHPERFVRDSTDIARLLPRLRGAR